MRWRLCWESSSWKMSQGLGLCTGKQRTNQSSTLWTSGRPGAAAASEAACCATAAFEANRTPAKTPARMCFIIMTSSRLGGGGSVAGLGGRLRLGAGLAHHLVMGGGKSLEQELDA